MLTPKTPLILVSAALALLGAASGAQSQSGKLFARYNKPLRSATLDLATGTLTRGPLVHNRAATTIADFQNIDLSGFSGIDTGGGFCEWFDAGVKGFAGNASDLMDSIIFSYCSAKLTPGSGGPGGSVKLGFWEGYTTGGGPSTSVASFTLTGLPANSASSSFFGGFKCMFLRIQMSSLVCFADGNIGYSWKFLDNGTGTINPLGATLAGTWPFMACVVSCSGSIGQVDGQGMTDMIDKYCPPGTLRTTFTMGTASGSYTSMSMQIEEVTTKLATVSKFNSATFPNPDTLCAQEVVVGEPWSASVTLALDRLANFWVMFFGSVADDVLIPQGSAGLNFGTNKNGRMLLSPRVAALTVITPHTGIAGSTSTTAPSMIPKDVGLVCNPWCGQAVVVGGLSAADGGGGVRLTSAVSGVIGTNVNLPMADFAGGPLTGAAPLVVGFSDLSTGDVTAWSWNFGDSGTSTLQHPGHTYTVSGLYTVSLTVSGSSGSDNETKAGYVTVGNVAPVAAFSGTPLSGTAPLAVSFTDLSMGTVTSWSWDFGDTNTSTLQNPGHSYTSAGTYTVTLTVTGPGGSDGETKTGYVTVSEPAPSAEFSGTPLSGTAPLAVSFTDLSAGTVTSWSWNFGDAGTSTLQNPGHTYASSGAYTVTLTVTGPGGSDMKTKIGYVTVSEAAPIADFSGTPLAGLAPLGVSFTNLTSGTVTTWSWNFGDSGTSTLQNPMHTYASAGLYTVTLAATGPGGSDSEVKVGYVVVTEPPPVAEFSGTPLTNTAPQRVQFSDLSTGAVTSWSWDFGDGSPASTAPSPSHRYAHPGSYTVTLLVTGPGGGDSETKVDYVVLHGPYTEER